MNINSKTNLATATIQNITNEIQDELLKRGFTARLSVNQVQDKYGKTWLEITSEPFNTVPVIMKEIKINGSLNVGENTENDEILNVGGRIGVEYSHFSGGTNGTELFWWYCTARKKSTEIYAVAIK